MKMKKIYLGLLASVALITSSCDMNTTNFGVIDMDNAIESKADAQKFLNGIYGNLRGCTAGGYVAYTDIQMDKFVGTIGNGNRLGQIAKAQILATNQEITPQYSGLYGNIGATNYFIPEAEKLLEDPEITDEDKTEINYMIGCAKFARAYYYWYLLDHFCETPSATNLDTPAKGLQLVTVYHPSADRSTYPGRSTIREAIKLIDDNLAEAYTAIKAYENAGNMQYVGPNAAFLISYAVEALQARMALICGDNATALAKAEDVINSGHYALTEAADYANMWINDEGDELIFVPFGDQQEGAPTTGVNWVTNNSKTTSDYIPTPDALVGYSNGDVRFDAFFSVYRMTIAGIQVQAYAFTKYPGNPTLNTGSTNAMRNKPKPFRLSELYLIAAEAAAATNATAKANDYLNALCSKRIQGYQDVNLSGSNLVDAIREERALELIGEGFRMSDLRRWNESFVRTCDFSLIGAPGINDIVDPAYVGVRYNQGANMFIWPIPYDEMAVNPQLEGQQNPGY